MVDTLKAIYRNILFAVLIAIVMYVDMHYSYARQGWMTITVLAMTQFTVGTWIRQTLFRAMTLIAVLLTAHICVELSQLFNFPVLFWLTLILGLLSLLIFEVTFASVAMMFVMCLLFTNFMPWADLQDQVLDVFIASAIMLILSSIVTLITIRKAFINLMLQYIDYLIVLVDNIHAPHAKSLSTLIALNNSLQHNTKWVFSLGFSPGLRAGFRFYLLEIERAIELLLNLNQERCDPELVACFNESMFVNKQMLQILRDFFRGHHLTNTPLDWMQDIIQFEHAMKKSLPNVQHSVYIHYHELAMIRLFKNAKDLRLIFLQLLSALPNSLR